MEPWVCPSCVTAGGYWVESSGGWTDGGPSMGPYGAHHASGETLVLLMCTSFSTCLLLNFLLIWMNLMFGKTANIILVVSDFIMSPFCLPAG